MKKRSTQRTATATGILSPVIEQKSIAADTIPQASPELQAARHRLIEQKAYELWNEAGKPSGNDLHFWLQAEDIINLS